MTWGMATRNISLTVTLSHYPTKTVIGQGVGSCSTMESKYTVSQHGGLRNPQRGHPR